MRKASIIITVCLAILSLGAFAYTSFIIYGGRFPLEWYPRYEFLVMATAGLTATACLGWTLVTWQVARGDGETRCRKCRYILRGITEPICPECGTPI